MFYSFPALDSVRPIFRAFQRPTRILLKQQRRPEGRRIEDGLKVYTRWSGGDLRTARLGPIDMEELAARHVHPLIGMRAEEVALGLE